MVPPLSLSVGPRRCVSCGSPQVQRSRRHNPIEWLLLALLLRPFRCTQCNKRHYGFFFRKRATSVTQAGSESSTHHQTTKRTVS